MLRSLQLLSTFDICFFMALCWRPGACRTATDTQGVSHRKLRVPLLLAFFRLSLSRPHRICDPWGQPSDVSVERCTPPDSLLKLNHVSLLTDPLPVDARWDMLPYRTLSIWIQAQTLLASKSEKSKPQKANLPTRKAQFDQETRVCSSSVPLTPQAGKI